MRKYLKIIQTERLSFHISDDFWSLISPNESTCQIFDQNVWFFFFFFLFFFCNDMVCVSSVYDFWLGSWNLKSFLSWHLFFVNWALLFWWKVQISHNNKNWKTFISCQWRFLKLYFPNRKHMSDPRSECVLLFCHCSSSSSSSSSTIYCSSQDQYPLFKLYNK